SRALPPPLFDGADRRRTNAAHDAILQLGDRVGAATPGANDTNRFDPAGVLERAHCDRPPGVRDTRQWPVAPAPDLLLSEERLARAGAGRRIDGRNV
ncbi:MAG TPA: hypothetical protein VF886_14760, partial [Roseiarcus sp.]